MVRFIGDIHGNVPNYAAIIDQCDESVQIGDFGIGFFTDYEFVDELHADGKHKFIRGNHDDPAACAERPGYIPDGTYDDRGLLYVGGAWSIDWARRVQYMDMGGRPVWWKDEELSVAELSRMHELYVHHTPRIMVTHDAPTSVANELFISPFGRKQFLTRTAEAFEGMFQRYQPDIWVFGHWHENVDKVINGTRFICLGIDSYIDLEV